MDEQEKAQETAPLSVDSNAPTHFGRRLPNAASIRTFLAAGAIALASIAVAGFAMLAAIGVGLSLAVIYAWDAHRRSEERLRILAKILDSVRHARSVPMSVPTTGELAPFISEWNEVWQKRCDATHEFSVIADGVRGLPTRLETTFGSVVMVADEASLLEGAARLQPEVAIVDLSLARDNGLGWLRELRQRCPDLKVIVLSVHDEQSVRRAAIEAGADAFVLKRAIATDLLPAVDSVRGGQGEETKPDEGRPTLARAPSPPVR